MPPPLGASGTPVGPANPRPNRARNRLLDSTDDALVTDLGRIFTSRTLDTVAGEPAHHAMGDVATEVIAGAECRHNFGSSAMKTMW